MAGGAKSLGRWVFRGAMLAGGVFPFLSYNIDNPNINLNFSSFLGNYITTHVRKPTSCRMEFRGNCYDSLGDCPAQEILAQIPIQKVEEYLQLASEKGVFPVGSPVQGTMDQLPPP